MVFKRIFRSKRNRKASIISKNYSLPRRVCSDDDGSFDMSEVSSLGISMSSETAAATTVKRRNTRPITVRTILSQDASLHERYEALQASVTDAIHMSFPQAWQERTGSMPSEDASIPLSENPSEASLHRRREIVEEDYDPNLSWDASITVDEDFYRTEDLYRMRLSALPSQQHSCVASALSFLACV